MIRLVRLLQAVRLRRFQAWLEKQQIACHRERVVLAGDDRDAWLASFDANGNFLHWSGWWESNAGWSFFKGRWMWLVPDEDIDGQWIERADLAPIIKREKRNHKPASRLVSFALGVAHQGKRTRNRINQPHPHQS